jgi:hypothetical protein
MTNPGFARDVHLCSFRISKSGACLLTHQLNCFYMMATAGNLRNTSAIRVGKQRQSKGCTATSAMN